MGNQRGTFAKRRREQNLKDKARDKAERLASRRAETGGTKGPAIAWADGEPGRIDRPLSTDFAPSPHGAPSPDAPAPAAARPLTDTPAPTAASAPPAAPGPTAASAATAAPAAPAAKKTSDDHQRARVRRSSVP
jgi:hypothetical protein